MNGGEKLGSLYFDLQADVNSLNAEIKKIQDKLNKEVNKQKTKIDFDTSLGKLKLDQLQNYYDKLKRTLNKKLEANVDVASLKRTTEQLKKVEGVIGEIKGKAKGASEDLSKWALIMTGINQTVELVKNTFTGLKATVMDSIKASNSLVILRANFKGTAEDMELFRKATSDTVTEANLIKLSNQATDLGISLDQQVLLFSMADDAADRYATSVEEGISRVILASEGSTRALKDLGVQKEVYEEIVDSLAKAQGTTIEKLDAESQKQIRLQAIIQASGITINDVKSKVRDIADKYDAFSTRIEEAKVALGGFIAEALLPVIDEFDHSSNSAKDVTSAIIGIGSVALEAAPLIIQLKSAEALMGATSVITAGQVNTTTGAVVGLRTALMSLLPWVGVIAAATIGGAMVYNYAKQRPGELKEKDNAQRLKNQGNEPYKPLVDDNSNGGAWFTNPKYTGQVTNNYKKAELTVGDVKKQIEQLAQQQDSLVIGSKDYLKNLAEIKRLSALIDNAKTEQKSKAEYQKEYYEAVKFEDTSYYNWKKSQIEKELAEYQKNGLSESKIDKMRTERLKVLTREYEEYFKTRASGKDKVGNLSDPINERLTNSPIQPVNVPKTESTTPIGAFEQMESWVDQTAVAQIAMDSFIEGAMTGFDELRIKVNEDSDMMTKAFAGFANYAMQAVEQIIAKWAILNLFSAFAPSGAGVGLFSMLGFANGGTVTNYGGGNVKVNKFASGANFVVPPGFPNDSYPMMVQSGERVQVTPANQVRSEDGAIISQLQSVRTAIQALNINMMNSKTSNFGSLELESTIEGNDIYLTNKKATKINKRYR